MFSIVHTLFVSYPSFLVVLCMSLLNFELLFSWVQCAENNALQERVKILEQELASMKNEKQPKQSVSDDEIEYLKSNLQLQVFILLICQPLYHHLGM
jgi:hypothetical protein